MHGPQRNPRPLSLAYFDDTRFYIRKFHFARRVRYHNERVKDDRVDERAVRTTVP
jgi:hypothetical protein